MIWPKVSAIILTAAALTAVAQRTDEYAMHRDSEAHKAFLIRGAQDTPSAIDRERQWKTFAQIIPGLIRTENIQDVLVDTASDGTLVITLYDIHGQSTTLWAGKFQTGLKAHVKAITDY